MDHGPESDNGVTVRQDLRGDTVVTLPQPPGPTRGRRMWRAAGLAGVHTLLVAGILWPVLSVDGRTGVRGYVLAVAGLALMWFGWLYLYLRLSRAMLSLGEPRLHVTGDRIASGGHPFGDPSPYKPLDRRELRDFHLVRLLRHKTDSRTLAWRDGEGVVRPWRTVRGIDGDWGAWREGVAAVRAALSLADVPPVARRPVAPTPRSVRLPQIGLVAPLVIGGGLAAGIALLLLTFGPGGVTGGFAGRARTSDDVVTLVTLSAALGVIVGGALLFAALNNVSRIVVGDGTLRVRNGFGQTLATVAVAEVAGVTLERARFAGDPPASKPPPRLCLQLAGGAAELVVLDVTTFQLTRRLARLETLAADVRAAVGLGNDEEL